MLLELRIIGNVGQDATINTVNGKKVINFSVAHTERYKDANGTETSNTTWLNCSYWVDNTNIAPYLKKGTLLHATGRPEPRIFKAKDGSNKIDFTLRVSTIKLLSVPKEENNQVAAAAQPAPATAGDDLPF